MLARDSKRGHIPTFLLIVYAGILIAAACISFFNANAAFNSNSDQVTNLASEINYGSRYLEELAPQLVARAIQDANNGIYDFETGFNIALKDASDKVYNISDVKTDFFGKIRSGEYELTSSDGNYNLLVKDVSVYSKIGNNEIKRSFDISVKFNQTSILK